MDQQPRTVCERGLKMVRNKGKGRPADPRQMTPERMLEIGADPYKNKYDIEVLEAAWLEIRDRKEHRPAKAAIKAEIQRRGAKVPPRRPAARRYVPASEASPRSDAATEPKRKAAIELNDRGEILWRLAATQKGGLEEGNRIAFEAALEMFVLLGKLKTTEFDGRLLTTAEYLSDAESAGVGRTYAHEVIQFRLFGKTDEIRAKVKADYATHVAKRGKQAAFGYPSIRAMLNAYRPDTTKPHRTNRAAVALAAENLRLADDISAMAKTLEYERAAHERKEGQFREYRNEADDEIERLRAKVAEQAAEIERLTALIPSGD